MLLQALSPVLQKKPAPQTDNSSGKQIKAASPAAEITLQVNGCFLQLPVSRDSKNFLFFGLDRLLVSQSGLADCSDSQISLKCAGIELFVAKQIDQACKYYLF